jgi:putative membrane protein
MCLFAILRWFINAVLLMIITYLVPGVEITSFFTALVVALVLGLVNAVIRPLIIILTLPINILTLGLFTLIINAFMFWLVSDIVKGFTITNFWSAFFAALIYALVSMFISSMDRSEPTVKVIK